MISPRPTQHKSRAYKKTSTYERVYERSRIISAIIGCYRRGTKSSSHTQTSMILKVYV